MVENMKLSTVRSVGEPVTKSTVSLSPLPNSITSFLLSSSQVECWRNTSILANDIDSAGIILGLEVKDGVLAVAWLENEKILAAATDEDVIPQAAVKKVRTIVTLERVV